MNKLIISTLICITGTFAGMRSGNGNTAVTAAVEQQNGLHVFVNSKPISEYTFLGNVKSTTVEWNGDNCFCELTLPAMIQALTKAASKKYSDATAIIYNGGNTCEVIKLKQ